MKYAKFSPPLGFWPFTGTPVEVHPLAGSAHATQSSALLGLPHITKVYPHYSKYLVFFPQENGKPSRMCQNDTFDFFPHSLPQEIGFSTQET